MKIDIYFDGSCKNVKSSQEEPTGLGVAVFIEGEYSEVFSEAKAGNLGTNNTAEYESLLLSLKIIKELKDLIGNDEVELEIYSDSMLVVSQFNKEWEVKQQHLLEYTKKCWLLAKPLNINRINWVPREQNTHADILSKDGRKQAMEK